MKKIIDFVKTFDLLTPFEPLKVGSRSKTKTVFGSCLTICTVILVILAGISIGEELILKEKPTILAQDKFESESPPLYFKEDTFSFGFRVENELAQSIENFEQYFTFTAMFEISEKTTTGYQTERVHLSVEKCKNLKRMTASDLEKDKNMMISFKDLYCIKETDLNVYGNWNGNKIKGLSIYLSKCKGKNCANDTEINSLINNYLSLNIYYTDVTINHQNFNKPISRRISNIFQSISSVKLKGIFLFLKKTTINTDTGFFLTDIRTEYANKFDSKEVEITDGFFPYLFYLTIISSSNTQTVNRFYMKIQDLLAQLGGIISFFMASIRILTYFYKLNTRDINLINEYIDFNNESTSKKRRSLYKDIYSSNVMSKSPKRTKNFKISVENKKLKKKESKKNIPVEKVNENNYEIELNIDSIQNKEKKKISIENNEISNNDYKLNPNNEIIENSIEVDIHKNDNKLIDNFVTTQNINTQDKKNTDKETNKSFWLDLYKTTVKTQKLVLNFFEKFIPFQMNICMNSTKRKQLKKLRKMLYESVGMPQFFKFFYYFYKKKGYYRILKILSILS